MFKYGYNEKLKGFPSTGNFRFTALRVIRDPAAKWI
jgi:hypothetical protein